MSSIAPDSPKMMRSFWDSVVRGVRAGLGSTQYMGPEEALQELCYRAPRLSHKGHRLDLRDTDCPVSKEINRLNKLLWVLTSAGAVRLPEPVLHQLTLIEEYLRQVDSESFPLAVGYASDRTAELVAANPRAEDLHPLDMVHQARARCEFLREQAKSTEGLQAAIDALQNELKTGGDEERALLNKLQALRISAQTAIQQKQDEIDALQAKNQELEDALAGAAQDLRQERAALQERLLLLTEENRELRTLNQSLQDQNEDLTDSLEAARARIGAPVEAEAHYVEVKELPRELLEELQALRSENKQLQSEVKLYELEQKETLAAIDRARTEKQRALDKVREQEEQVANAHAEMGHMVGEAERVRQAFELIGWLPEGAIQFPDHPTKAPKDFLTMLGIIGKKALEVSQKP